MTAAVLTATLVLIYLAATLADRVVTVRQDTAPPDHTGLCPVCDGQDIIGDEQAWEPCFLCSGKWVP